MQPAAIALNYSVKYIRNSVRCTIHIHVYIRKNPLFNSLVWGSLMLAPITWHSLESHSVKCEVISRCWLLSQLKCTVASDVVDNFIMNAVQKLRYDRATLEQGKVIREVLLWRDVLVSLPTGEGKSFCYASLPLVFDWIKECHIRTTITAENLSSSIVLVVSPLIALIKDQVESFSKRRSKK